jgi:hypothetical protein
VAERGLAVRGDDMATAIATGIIASPGIETTRAVEYRAKLRVHRRDGAVTDTSMIGHGDGSAGPLQGLDHHRGL